MTNLIWAWKILIVQEQNHKSRKVLKRGGANKPIKKFQGKSLDLQAKKTVDKGQVFDGMVEQEEAKNRFVCNSENII
jgi:hypothetical protein